MSFPGRELTRHVELQPKNERGSPLVSHFLLADDDSAVAALRLVRSSTDLYTRDSLQEILADDDSAVAALLVDTSTDSYSERLLPRDQ